MTGAPKIRAMQIIRELELGPRGVYSGAIGYVGVDGSAEFGMVIRTLVFKAGFAKLGVGGGWPQGHRTGGEDPAGAGVVVARWPAVRHRGVDHVGVRRRGRRCAGQCHAQQGQRDEGGV